MSPDTPVRRKAPVFGALALLLFLATCVVPVVGFLVTMSAVEGASSKPRPGEQLNMTDDQFLGGVGIVVTGAAVLVCALLGLVAGVVALARGERYRWAGLAGGVAAFAILAAALAFLNMG